MFCAGDADQHARRVALGRRLFEAQERGNDVYVTTDFTPSPIIAV